MKCGAWTRVTTAAACGAAALALAASATIMGACAPAAQNATVGSVWVKAEPGPDAAGSDAGAGAVEGTGDNPVADASAGSVDSTADDPAVDAPSGARKTFAGTAVGEGFPTAGYLSVEDLSALVESGSAFTALDIRSLKSYAALHAEGTLNIPENQIPFRSDEIPAGQPVVLIADTGNTLQKARQYLLDAGFADADIKALDGGMANIWSVTGMKMESGSLEAYAC